MNDLDLLRAADPASGALPRTQRAEFLVRLRQLPPDPDAARAAPVALPQRRHVFLRSRLVAAAAVVALVLGGSVAWQVAGAGHPGGASPAAAAVLGQAAAAAIGAQDPTIGPRQYLKITIKEVASVSTPIVPDSGLTYLEQSSREVWMPANPSDVWVQRRGQGLPVRFFRPQDEQLARDRGLLGTTRPAELLRAAGGDFYNSGAPAWGSPSPAFLATLPRDPDRLLAKIYRDTEGAGPSKDGEALVTIADVLRCGFVPADLRAALFRAATGIPGVEVVDRRANLDGRVGVAVGRDERNDGHSFRQELIFEENTGQVIGERRVELEADERFGVPAGEVVGATSVTTTVVDSAL